MRTIHEHEADRLIRSIESRVRVKEELAATVRGLVATAVIVGAITGLLLAVVVGAIFFATALQLLAR